MLVFVSVWGFDIKVICQCVLHRGHPLYSGSTLDCWSNGRAIDPAPGACFTTKLILLAQVVHGPVLSYSADSWPKTLVIPKMIRW